MLKPGWVSFNLNSMATAIAPALVFLPISPIAAIPFHLDIKLAQASAVQISLVSPPPQSHQADPLEAFMQAFNQRRRQREGIRRSGFCVLSPSVVETDVIWSDRPLFLWHGAAKQITLAKLGSSEKLWSQAIDLQVQQVHYSGVALQPGEIYQWELLGESSTKTSLIFQVMESNQRSQIATQLQEIETQLKARGASTEVIAIQQAQLFANQNLWSDALQLLYSIDNPSPETVQAIQQIEATLCGS